MFNDGTRTAYSLAVKVYYRVYKRRTWYKIEIPVRAQYIE